MKQPPGNQQGQLCTSRACPRCSPSLPLDRPRTPVKTLSVWSSTYFLEYFLQTLEILFFRSHLEKLNNGFCFPLDFKSADNLLLRSCVAVPLTRNNKILVCYRMNIRMLPSVVPLTKTIASSNTSSSAKKENTTEHLRDVKDLIPG